MSEKLIKMHKAISHGTAVTRGGKPVDEADFPERRVAAMLTRGWAIGPKAAAAVKTEPAKAPKKAKE